jgi:hypothetical protein
VPAVRRVNDCILPTWDETQRLLIQLRDKPGTQVSLEVADDTWFVFEYVEDFGYYMSGCGPSDRDYFNLIDSRLGDEITQGYLAHELNSFPRYALVGQETLLRAAKTFFESGDRDPSCEWVPERDASYN